MKRYLIFSLLVLSLPVVALAQAASNGAWTDLGSLGSGKAIAFGVSADGGVVTGVSSVTGDFGSLGGRGFRWTAAGGMQGITFPNDGGVGNAVVGAWGISADGSTIVGFYGGNPCAPGCALLWTLAGLDAKLPPPGWFETIGMGVSKDGGVMVGWASDPGYHSHAWRWTSSTGFVALPDWLNSPTGSEALAVSEDGNVTAGFSVDTLGTIVPSAGYRRAVRKTWVFCRVETGLGPRAYRLTAAWSWDMQAPMLIVPQR